MDCAKLIASFFVVWIHVHFPEPLGSAVDYLGQFAVPMFLVITGYFNFGARPADVVRRIKHIFLLYIAGNVMYALYVLLETVYTGQDAVYFIMRLLPDQKGLTKWIVVQSEFIAGQLWYLHSVLVVYALYWGYLRFYDGRKVDYRPLFLAGFVFMAIYFAVRVIAVLYVSDYVDITGNAFLTAIPMFTLGLFLRAYQDQITAAFPITNRGLWITILIGELLTVQQWRTYGKGMALGTFVSLLALLLFCVRTPRITLSRKLSGLIDLCGQWSIYIYLFHLPIAAMYDLLLENAVGLKMGASALYLRPILILAGSWLFAVLCNQVMCAVRKGRKKQTAYGVKTKS